MKTKITSVIGMSVLMLAGAVSYAQSPSLVKHPPNPNLQMRNMPQCPTGFTRMKLSSGTGYACASPIVHCPTASSVTGASSYGGMQQPVARVMGSGQNEAVQFSFRCMYYPVN